MDGKSYKPPSTILKKFFYFVMWVELAAVIHGKYHNVPKTMSPKKEIRNSKTATYKTHSEYISEHWSENGSMVQFKARVPPLEVL